MHSYDMIEFYMRSTPIKGQVVIVIIVVVVVIKIYELTLKWSHMVGNANKHWVEKMSLWIGENDDPPVSRLELEKNWI